MPVTAPVTPVIVAKSAIWPVPSNVHNERRALLLRAALSIVLLGVMQWITAPCRSFLRSVNRDESTRPGASYLHHHPFILDQDEMGYTRRFRVVATRR